MRISDWSSDVCSSDLHRRAAAQVHDLAQVVEAMGMVGMLVRPDDRIDLAHAGIEKLEPHVGAGVDQQPEAAERNEDRRSEEHTSELQSLMRSSYAVFWLNKKIKN